MGINTVQIFLYKIILEIFPTPQYICIQMSICSKNKLMFEY